MDTSLEICNSGKYWLTLSVYFNLPLFFKRIMLTAVNCLGTEADSKTEFSFNFEFDSRFAKS